MDGEALRLPGEIVGWLEETTGLPLAAAERIPGGGIRQGWFVDFRGPGGAVRELFLRYSPRPESPAFHRLGTEAQVVRALSEAGARVPKIHAAHPSREAVLQDRIDGGTWFARIEDQDEQLRVAQDFVRQLAYVHRLDPARLRIPGLGPVRPAREHALERIEAIRERARRPDGTLDPLVRLSTDWLEHNVPDYDGPVVLVQGDTGPGNFLYRDGQVTAVVDWELAHWGDPMDDIAWLSLRTVQDTFTHLPDRIAEYTELSGHQLDVDRVWYYRVFAETTMATLRSGGPEEPGPPHDAGNRILYTQLHRRLWLEALDVVLGLGLRRPAEPEPAPPEPWHHLYDTALDMLRTITPRIDDPLAKQWTKGVARVLRYLREVDAAGRAVSADELGELAAELGTRPATVAEGREALARAAPVVPVERLVRLLWNQVMRDDFLMRSASGALRHRTWPPLR
ncbi:phosphotransferase family protein [Amycolatopsis sp.]|uniref:phosphotransferase family protein n=1 Tax=Amycolatopsis sp. TaxID=37632 RepID=UPI002C83202C|nr:phosphotransferase family protein [Amycolatopsis sp.]HVV12647.1 phosphotransferase family protein [Amycolatopsis sp.]